MTDRKNDTSPTGGRPWNDTTRIKRVRVHRDVFAAYVAVYECARIMVQKMDAVLDDPEHLELIDGGLRRGLRMPDVNGVRSLNRIIDTLTGQCDPLRDVKFEGDMAEFPARTARDLYMAAFYSSRMIEDVVRNINTSDYMLWIRTLKQAGMAYLGPQSLQEVFNVWGSLITSEVLHRRHTVEKGRRLPENWMKLVI